MASTRLVHFAESDFYSNGDATNPVSINPGSYHDFDIEYSVAFPYSPVPVVSMYSLAKNSSTPPVWYTANNFNAMVHSRSASGFTVRVYNNGDSALIPQGFYWIAIL